VATFFCFPDYLALGSQVLAMIIFALSVDLVLGYAGIVTLGHAAFFGTGAYTAGVLAANGWGEPLSGLMAGALVAGLVGLLSGAIILRTSGLTLLMQTLVVAAMLYELANKAHRITGGADGLQGMVVWPVFGSFRFDMFGRTAYLYSLAALLFCWLIVRTLVHSSFGRSLMGIRENVQRMHAVGAPVDWRKLLVYTLSAALAGLAGALLAQTTQFVGLGVLSLERSGAILIMLIIGVGRPTVPSSACAAYMIAQDRFATIDPVYWHFWIGLFMVLLSIRTRRHSACWRVGLSEAGPCHDRRSSNVDLREFCASLSPTQSIFASARRTACVDRPKWRRQDHLRQPGLGCPFPELRQHRA
jgi:branched-chain amino acid transport system permease protein